MNQTSDWQTAPKNGSVIVVQFPDGTENQARWSTDKQRWETPHEGKWCAINYTNGNRAPLVWWKTVA